MREISDQPLLEFDHFTKNDDLHEKLEDICFQLSPGETHCIYGIQIPLLRKMVSLLNEPPAKYSGIYHMFGQPAQFVRRRCGFQIMLVTMDSQTIDTLTVDENIMLHQKTWGVLLAKKRKEKCQRILDEFGITLDLNRQTFLLTPEEKKLIELLCVYATKPQIAVFYETMRAVETNLTDVFPKILNALKASGIGIIYITSSVEDALMLADNVSVADNGRLRNLADVESLRKNPYQLTHAVFGWEEISKNESAEKVAALKNILRTREAWAHESEMRRLLLYYTNDLEKAFHASSAMIYLIDEEQGSIVDYISDRDEVKHCSKLKPEHILTLTRDNNRMTVFEAKEIAERGLFRQKNEIRTLMCYSVRIQEKLCALLQLAFTWNWKPERQTEEYLEIFAREIRLAVENARLLGQSTLLQESHHRIKNNLQMIANLLMLQREDDGSVESARINAVLDSAIVRVKSIASVHNLLSGDRFGRSIVNLRRIIQEVARLYEQSGMNIIIDVDNISVPYNRATSIALLVNELINNVVKYAYPKEEGNRCINISGHSNGTSVILIVRDYGVGLKKDGVSGTGLGMTIIESVVSGLNGKIQFRSIGGLEAFMEFPRSTLMPITQADDRF